MKSLINFSALFVGLLLLIATNKSHAQVTFSGWAHYPYVTLYASATGTSVSTSSTIALDDVYSGVIPLGFNFDFYGTTYSNCVIGANGNISFDTVYASGPNPWGISTFLLGNTMALNSICGPWCDMDIIFGGDISYFVEGTAPNRRFVTSYCHDFMYVTPWFYTTTQIILYETSNIAEVHIGNKPTTTWNGGYAIVGVQNGAGTAATTAPGRDYPSVWTTTNEAWRFTLVSGGTAYAVNSISYAPLDFYTIFWYDSTTGAYLGSGDSIVIYDTSHITFTAVAVSCNDTATGGFDTVQTGHFSYRPGTLTVNQLDNNTEVTLYPNPANTQLNLVSDKVIEDLTVISPVGNVVYSGNYNSRQVQVNVASLPPGVYLIRVNGTMMKKFLKE